MKWFRKKRPGEERISTDTLAQIETLLSLVNDKSQPNLARLHLAVRNINVMSMNIKTMGYDLARRLADALPVRTDTVARHVFLESKASVQADIEADWVAHWCGQLRIPVVYHRKLWELSYVLQAIYEHGSLRSDARGLGFGCGNESIPSYLAGHGISVTMTDLPADEARASGWMESNQHAASRDQAFRPELVDRAQFDERVAWRPVDMTAIPADLVDYDFCWSICALEHLGSIRRGLDFIENSLLALKPGGLAVHTLEHNIDPDGPTIDNWGTVLFQRKHIEAIVERLRERGHHVAPLNFDLGGGAMDRFVDLPPWSTELPELMASWLGQPNHLKVTIDGFACTCFGLVIRKADI